MSAYEFKVGQKYRFEGDVWTVIKIDRAIDKLFLKSSKGHVTIFCIHKDKSVEYIRPDTGTVCCWMYE